MFSMDKHLRILAGVLKKWVFNSHNGQSWSGCLGGDEFLVVAPVPCMGEENCENLFDRLSSDIARRKIMTEAGDVSITVSNAVAMADVQGSKEQLLDRADTAMVGAKKEGANRVVFAR
jgi:diguanylate cyclase (GGDEF)-like protein